MPLDQTRELERQIFYQDFTQTKWHKEVDLESEQAFKNYIDLLKAQRLPRLAQKDVCMEISLKDEKETVMNLIKNSSVVPDGPN